MIKIEVTTNMNTSQVMVRETINLLSYFVKYYNSITQRMIVKMKDIL